MSADRKGVGEDRYEAVVLVKYCATVAGIAQRSKVEISNVALQKKIILIDACEKEETTHDTERREEETGIEDCVERNEGPCQVERHVCLNER